MSPWGVSNSKPNQDGEEAPQEKEKGDGREVEQCDPLVVNSEQPGANAVVCIQIVFPGFHAERWVLSTYSWF